MFEGEEYRSYIQLCRELRLPSVYWRQGDLQWNPRANPDAWPGQIVVISDRESAESASMAGNREVVWLPRLDQWLSMLEEAGVQSIRCMWHGRVAPSDRVRIEATRIDSVMDVVTWDCYGPTREEAAARLWMSVTGRMVTSG